MAETSKLDVEIGSDCELFLAGLMHQVKGKEPDNLAQLCLGLCQKYLAGNWVKLSISDIEIKRLTSGMSNQTYHCKIRGSTTTDDNEPEEVVIRLFGELNLKTLEQGDNKIDESIVALMASERGIGPKVYGVFKTGLIMKYYPHRHFDHDDLKDKFLLEQTAQKLAHFHSMKPPMAKDSSFAEDIMNSFLRKWDHILDQKKEIFREYNYKLLLECDLKAELGWLLNKIQAFDSPVIFTHSDFRVGNTLVTEDNKIVLSDFETSSYFYRGYDFASFFEGFEILGENSFEFKDEKVVKAFIDCYIRENEKLFGKQYSDNKINCIEHILMETKVFSLVYSLTLTAFFIDNETWKLPITEKTCLSMANFQVTRYVTIKSSLKGIWLGMESED